MADDFLFSEMLIVGVVQTPTGELRPEIKYHLSTSNTARENPLLKSCVSFCFPAIDVRREPFPASESFTYTLTEDDGTRAFGFCRRLLVPPNTLPDAICILTKRQWFSFYAHMLDILQLNFDLAAFIPPFMQAVARTPPPSPGGTVVVSPWGAGGQSFRLNAPDESMPPVASFELLFTALGTAGVLRLISALLNESRVVLIAEQLSDLSTVAHCAMALLQPFTWQHVFIPVLPTAMIDYVCAPMPFVVGVLECHRGLLAQQPMDACVFVDVSRSKLRGDEHVPQLPRPYRDTLFRKLEALRSKSHGMPRYEPRQLSDAFLVFFAELLHGYPAHVQPAAVATARAQLAAAAQSRGRPPRVALDDLFDHVGFVEAQPRDAHELLGAMRGVQMWESWLTESLLGAAPEAQSSAAQRFQRLVADAAARFAADPAMLQAKPKFASGAERALEAVAGLRFAMASASAPSLGKAASLGGGSRGSPTAHLARGVAVAAAVSKASSIGGRGFLAAQARAREIAASVRERSSQMSLPRRAGSLNQLNEIDAVDAWASVVVQPSHEPLAAIASPTHTRSQSTPPPLPLPPLPAALLLDGDAGRSAGAPTVAPAAPPPSFGGADVDLLGGSLGAAAASTDMDALASLFGAQAPVAPARAQPLGQSGGGGGGFNGESSAFQFGDDFAQHLAAAGAAGPPSSSAGNGQAGGSHSAEAATGPLF